MPLYIDNNSALKLTRNPEYHNKSKHIDVKHHFIREKVEEGAIDTQRVATKDNLADLLTKPLPRDSHQDQVERLNMKPGGAFAVDDAVRSDAFSERSNGVGPRATKTKPPCMLECL